MTRQDSFLKLLLGNERNIRAFIGSIVRQRETCDEVFQETALTLWEQFDRFDAQRSFGAWARGVAANKILQHRHQDQRFPVLLPPETINAVLESFNRTEKTAAAREDALEHCVESLAAKARELLRQRYGLGLKPRQIAASMGASVDAVYQALCRIRAALEKCVRNRLNAQSEGTTMANNDTNLQLLDRYLLDMVSQEEVAALAQRINTDPAFAQEFAQACRMDFSLAERFRTDKAVREIESLLPRRDKTHYTIPRWVYATTAAALVVAGVVWAMTHVGGVQTPAPGKEGVVRAPEALVPLPVAPSPTPQAESVQTPVQGMVRVPETPVPLPVAPSPTPQAEGEVQISGTHAPNRRAPLSTGEASPLLTRPLTQTPLLAMQPGAVPGQALPGPQGDPATPIPAEPSNLVVHEWGVWVRGANPGAGGGYVLGPPGQLNAELPQWVIKRNVPMTVVQPVPPPNGPPQKWRKPVIHFYHGEGLDVTVTVTIAKGSPTAYWPPAALTAGPRPQGGPAPGGGGGGMAPGGGGGGMAPGGFAPGAIIQGQLPARVMRGNILTWTGKLSADAPEADQRPAAAGKASVGDVRTLRDVPDGHWWSAIRKVPGLYLAAPGGCERFIFYEGTAAQDPILKATVSGETLTVQNTSLTTPSGPVLVILNDGQKLHWVSAKDLAAGGEVKWARADVEKGESDGGKLLEFSRDQWETFGLTKEEAAAVVEVWKADLTGHIGLMVVGKMPRDIYDQMFPLEVTPKPAQIVRVGVVFDALPGQADRTQWLPGLEGQLRQWGKELDDDKYEVREAAGKKFAQTGELAVPYLKKLAESDSAEVKNAAQRLLKEIEQQEQVGGSAAPPVMRPPIRIAPVAPVPLPAPAN